MTDRLSWDEYFMKITHMVASRSTCDRAMVGCLLVNDDNRIVSSGYNGSISGNDHCDDVGHTIRDGHCIATIHAEINALIYCAKEGISVNNCKAYITHFPCLNCTKALIQAGIKEINYSYDYRVDPYALELFKKNNIKIKKLS